MVGLSAASAQSSATIKMDGGEVTAGDTVNMVVTFDRPATCSQTARVYMAGPSSNGGENLDFRHDSKGLCGAVSYFDGQFISLVSLSVPGVQH
jgi:hypothetical protein